MSAKLSVIFYIILCLEIGIVLALLPWVPQGTLGLSDWGNNYFLLYAARKTGMYGLQTVVASGWVRGAVTGLGVLNLGMAFWEMFHFKQSVAALQQAGANSDKKNASSAKTMRESFRCALKFPTKWRLWVTCLKWGPKKAPNCVHKMPLPVPCFPLRTNEVPGLFHGS